MAKEEKKAPKLRFNGYTNDWEQQELGAVVEFYSGLTYKPENVVQNGTLVIRSSNIHNNQYINADNVYVKNNIVNSEYVQEQDIIVVVRNGSRNLIGKHALLKSIPHDPSVIGAFMTGIRSLNNQFIEAVLNTEKFKREINKNLGATINQITTSQFKKMKFNFPKREEDKQIGILFNYLDDTIQLHERKCEELALIKKALLQKLFPKKDEIKPEVRYKNFNDTWEQRKLGETSKITAGGDVDKEKLLTHGKYPVIANALTNDGIVGYYNDAYRITAPAVTVTGRGEIGKAKSRKINFTPVVRLLSVESKHNVDFLAEAINRSKVVFESTGVPQLTVPKLSNYKISFPVSENEETKIGDFIQQFDSLIALHQRKLEKLKQLKKFLLQNMFI